MSRQIITARVERIDHTCTHNAMTERHADPVHAWQCATCGYVYGQELYRVVVNHDGAIVLTDETYTVCSRVAHLLCNPLAEIGTECAEVADSIREAYANGRI